MNQLKDYLALHEISEMHPADIAKLLKNLDEEKFSEAIKLVPKSLIGDVALALPDRYFDDVVESLNVDELSLAVSELERELKRYFLPLIKMIKRRLQNFKPMMKIKQVLICNLNSLWHKLMR